MGLYNKYQINRLLRLCLIIAFFLTIVLWVTQSFRIFDLIISNGVEIKDFLKLSIYILPLLIYNILPFTILLTAVLEVHKMIKEKELLILQSNRYSDFQIAKPFIISSVLMTLIALLFSSYLVPKGYKEFKRLQFSLQQNYASFLLEKGIFSSKINGLTFYIANRSKDDIMHGILMNDSRTSNKEITITAKFGRLSINDSNIALVLQNGTRQEYDRLAEKLTLITFNKYLFNLELANFLKQKYTDGPNEKYIDQVIEVAFKEKDNSYIVNFHNRILWPLFCIILGSLPIALSVRNFYHRYINRYNNIKLFIYSTTLVSIFTFGENLAAKNVNWSFLMYISAILPIIFILWLLTLRREN
ncbi:MAG: LptF/LptG family permease [Candidatus Midichloria sp.]|nr:MAG: LptF/LptG family permease [Candidatus Midichloria sp.]